ncbi:MAG TPA: NAD(P)-binding domain-containing protein [Stellaceae bacterium]|nr:NAD(P)-binding domain-containing protein [Stellaceae bacterium]
MAQNAATGRSRRAALRLAVAAAPALLMTVAWPGAAGAEAKPAQPLKIGMIGSGREGGALGSLWVKAGHPVMFSSRHPGELKDLVAGLGPLAHAGTVAQAIAFGDVVAIVVPYPAMREIGRDYAAALAKKALVIDVSNPIARRDGDAIVDWANQQGGAGLATAKLLPGAHLVRGFNAIGSTRLSEDAHHAGGELGIPIAGDDPKAIAIASTLIREIGYEPVLIGGLAKGKYLVPGTPLAGEHTPAEIRQIASGLG